MKAPGSQDANLLTVKRYLLIECGVKEDRVDALLNSGKEHIERGKSLRSMAYYVGDRILEQFGSEDDIVPNFVAPEFDEDDESED